MPIDILHEMRRDAVLSRWLLGKEATEHFPMLSAHEMSSSTGRCELENGTKIGFDQLFVPLSQNKKFLLGYFFCPDLVEFRGLAHSKSQSENFQRLPRGRFILDLDFCRMCTVSHGNSLSVAGSALDFAPEYGLRSSSWFFGKPKGLDRGVSINADSFHGSGRFWDERGSHSCEKNGAQGSWRLRNWDSFRQLLGQVGDRLTLGQSEVGPGILKRDCHVVANSSSIISHGDSCSSTISVLRWLFLGSMRLLDVSPSAADAALRRRRRSHSPEENRRSGTKKLELQYDPESVLLRTGESSSDQVNKFNKEFRCSHCAASFSRRNRMLSLSLFSSPVLVEF